MICAKNYVTDQVKRYINKFTPTGTVDAQMTMDGFSHLQSAYPVERNGERVLVPTSLLTDVEIDERMGDLQDMSDGCLAHRKELSDYKEARRQAA